ncbi:hypothetical protein EJP50_24390 [Escherichia coli]|nr:hypothetical protein [Escherichia coli]
MTTGGGLIELGELAKGLGKQKGNVVRKLESMFPEDWLFKLKTQTLVISGKGETRTLELNALHRTLGLPPAKDAYFHERRSLNNFHRDRVITFEQIAE